jgi:probable phosphoglycerate mutase
MTADRLLLWRHGRTASNAGGRFQGQLDVPLDAVGRVHVKEAAEQLAAEIGPRFCRIVSSDLSRAHDTALALATRLDLRVTPDPALRELHLGSWQGLLREEVIARDPAMYHAWRSGAADVRPGGGEQRGEAAVRTEQAIRGHAAAQDGGVLVVVSHGAVLRGTTLLFMGLEHWSYDVLAPLRNGHWAQFDRRRDRWILSAYNQGTPQTTQVPEG